MRKSGNERVPRSHIYERADKSGKEATDGRRDPRANVSCHDRLVIMRSDEHVLWRERPPGAQLLGGTSVKG